MMRILSVAVLAFLFVSPHAQAETSAPFPPLAANDLFSRLQAGATLPRYLGVISQEFRNLDANSDGDLSEADAEMHKTMMIAQQRNNHVHAIMRYDLDGDGAVTEEELRRSKAYEHRMMVAQNDNARWENEILSLLSADTDKDGKITYAEAVQYAAGNEQLRRAAQNLNAGGWAARVRNLLTLDASGKGQISLADLQAAATALFRAVDTDGNGTISQDEQQAYRSANVSPAMGGVDLSPACKLPKASEQAKVILLSAYETDALSTATIGSQDIAVHTGRIEIEAGKEPLYLVVVSHRPVIWRLSGAVERIEQLVLAGNSTGPNRGIVGQQPVVGEMGVAKERVNILPRSNCLRYFTDKPSSASAIAAAKVRQDTGKEPMVAAIYQVSEFRVPSGQAISSTKNARPTLLIEKPAGSLVIQGGPNSATGPRIAFSNGNLASETNRFYPGGIVKVDASKVIASAPAENYEVLPNQAGLMQLVDSGALEQNKSREFLIKKKIRFPAELYGAHAVRFLLLRGVPEPEGDPGHSCVIVEETGAPLKGNRSCR